MKTVIAGQLYLSKLLEMLMTIPSAKLLMVNTDGGEIMISKKHEEMFNEICKQWESITKLHLEHNEYQKLIIRDVNNYIGVFKNNKIKRKGFFKLNEELIADGEYHKNFSFNIIKKAVSNYFINNIPVEDTILKCKDIYEFTGVKKFKGNHYAMLYNDNGEVTRINKILRYYISTNGGRLIKHYASKSDTEEIEKGYRITNFNKFEKKDEYHINYNYYIHQSKKMIQTIKTTQLSLF